MEKKKKGLKRFVPTNTTPNKDFDKVVADKYISNAPLKTNIENPSITNKNLKEKTIKKNFYLPYSLDKAFMQYKAEYYELNEKKISFTEFLINCISPVLKKYL